MQKKTIEGQGREMEGEMQIKEIVMKFLIDNKYDGLYDKDCECACDINDLFPCDDVCPDCIAGYKGPCECEEEHIFHIGPKKPEKSHG